MPSAGVAHRLPCVGEDPVADYDREDRTLAPVHSDRAARRPPALRGPRRRASRGRRLGARVQPHPAPPGRRHGPPTRHFTSIPAVEREVLTLWTPPEHPASPTPTPTSESRRPPIR